MDDILQPLNPPRCLRGLFQIQDNVSRIATLVPDDRRIQQILAALESQAADRKRNPECQPDYRQTAKKRFHGLISDHPLWVALYVDNRDSMKVAHLQRMLILAVLDVDIVSRLKTHDLAEMSLIVRYLRDCLDTNPHGQITINYAQELTLKRFGRVLGDVYVTRRNSKCDKEFQNQTTGEREGETRDRFGRTVTYLKTDPDDPHSRPSLAEYIPDNQGVKKYDDYLREEPHQVFIINDEIRRPAVEMRLNRQRARSAAYRMARHNNALAISYENLTDTELRKILHLIESEKQSKNNAMSIVLEIMLMTASTITEVMSLLENKRDSSLIYDKKKDAFKIKRIFPEYKTSRFGVGNEITDTELTGSEYVCVPNFTSYKGTKRLVDTPLDERFIQDVKIRLRGIGERCTLSRISNQLLNIARGSFDPVQVQITFGRRVAQAQSQQYYTAISSEQVYECYTQSANELRSRMGLQPLVANESKSGYYSPRDVPTVDDVKNILREIVYARKRAYGDEIRLHNLNTVLCIFSQSIFTCVRGVHDPIVAVEDAEYPIYYRDKDKVDFSHARFQFVHPYAGVIWRFYKEIRRKSLRSFNLKVSDKSFFISDQYRHIRSKPSNVERFLSEFSDYPVNSMRKMNRTYFRKWGVSEPAINMILNHNSQGESPWHRHNMTDQNHLRREIIHGYNRLINEIEIKESWFYGK